MFPGLEVIGHLDVLADDERIRVEFRGGVVAVEVPDLRTALALRRKWSRGERGAWLRRLQDVLRRTGLELHVRVGRWQVGRLAGVTRPRWASTALGLGPLELKFRRTPTDPAGPAVGRPGASR